VVRLPQPAAECTQEAERHSRHLLDAPPEVVAVQHQQLGILRRDDARRIGLVIHQRHLAEEVALPQQREDDFPSVFGDQHDLHLSGEDDVERVARIVGEEDDAVPRALPRLEKAPEKFQVALSKLREERHVSKRLGGGHVR
jgi:hypothetical protein